jgi:hypothetical protein
MPDKKPGILDEFTHEMFVIERDKVPEELKALNAPGSGVVAWGLWEPKDVSACSASPGELLSALIEAEANLDWQIVRELIEDMGGECVPEDDGL